MSRFNRQIMVSIKSNGGEENPTFTVPLIPEDGLGRPRSQESRRRGYRGDTPSVKTWSDLLCREVQGEVTGSRTDGCGMGTETPVVWTTGRMCPWCVGGA